MIGNGHASPKNANEDVPVHIAPPYSTLLSTPVSGIFPGCNTKLGSLNALEGNIISNE